MYGLLSSMYNSYLIRNTTDKNKNEYFYGLKNTIATDNIPGYTLLILLSILFMVFTILCIFDIYMIRGYNTWLLVLVLSLLFVPGIGDILCLVILCYWFIYIRKQSLLLPKLNVL